MAGGVRQHALDLATEDVAERLGAADAHERRRARACWADIQDSEDSEAEEESVAAARGVVSGALPPELREPSRPSTLDASAAEFVPLTGVWRAPACEHPAQDSWWRPASARAAAAAPAKPRRHGSARPTPEAAPLLPPHVMPEASEETWQHRAEMRRKELEALRERLRAISAEKEVDDEASGVLPPDPIDRSLSRRQWKRLTDLWFRTMARHLSAEDGRSVASTEEGQSFAASSAMCDRGSECSD